MNKNNFIYDTKDFEDRFKRFTGVKYCVGVSSGTAALHLALDAIGIKKGDQSPLYHTLLGRLWIHNKICRCPNLFMLIYKRTLFLYGFHFV